jgi:hypothetical protein
MVDFNVMCTKLAESIRIKSAESNLIYGQLFTCQFSGRYSKVFKMPIYSLKCPINSPIFHNFITSDGVVLL